MAKVEEKVPQKAVERAETSQKPPAAPAAGSWQEAHVRVNTEKVFGPSDELGGIKAGDWRDPGVFQSLEGFHVVPRDRGFGFGERATEPDWTQGWYLQDPSTGQPFLQASGEPPEFFKEVYRRNLVLVGAIGATDRSTHN